MNRYKPVGWRYESHKHSLAAKGIKTKLYAKKENLSFSEFIDSTKKLETKMKPSGTCKLCKQYKALKNDRYCHECHELVHGGKHEDKFYALKDLVGEAPTDKPAFLSNHKLDGEVHQLRHQDINVERQKALARMEAAIKEGNMNPEAREHFMKEDFKHTSQEYLNGYITKSQYDDEIMRELDYHMKVNRKKLSPFDWAEQKEEAKEVQK